jgi:putative heme-binding domain-containing protein
MYRFVIEHPRWITPDRLAELDVRAGADLGRIYRIVPVRPSADKILRLDRLSTKELIWKLNDLNGVVRDLAQRVLVERKDIVGDELQDMALFGHAEGRVYALHTLNLLGSLSRPAMQNALTAREPTVRHHAIQLFGKYLEKNPDFSEVFISLADDLVDDVDAGTRFQLALTLGSCKDPRAGRTLAKLAVRDARDEYAVAAVLSSVNRGNIENLVAALAADGGKEPASGILARVLAVAPAVLERDRLPALLSSMIGEDIEIRDWRLVAASSLLDAAERRSIALPPGGALRRLTESARRVLADDKSSESSRLSAIRLLGGGILSGQADVPILAKLVSPQQPPAIQAAAIERLAQTNHASAPVALLADWSMKSPETRSRVLDVLLSRDTWLVPLLDALEKGVVRPGDLDAPRRQRLTAHRDAKIRERATKTLQGSLDPNRAKVVESYKSVKTVSGDAKAGVQVFAKTCAACHRVGDVGNAIGPDLAALSDRSTDALLIAILDPNRALDGRYAAFNVLTKRGQQFSGMLRSETAASITLVGPEGKKQEILRSEIEELTNTGKSLMPDGLEKDIAPKAMADLIAYLQSIGRPPKTVAGNKPALVKPGADGVLHLRASDCEIHGGEITFEAEFNNLGMWHGENDHVAWSMEVPKAGRYRVEISYACDNSSAGNTLVIQAGDSKLEFRVAGTGRWADYVDKPIGELDLPAGRLRLVARPAGAVRGALIDLKEVRLIP